MLTDAGVLIKNKILQVNASLLRCIRLLKQLNVDSGIQFESFFIFYNYVNEAFVATFVQGKLFWTFVFCFFLPQALFLLLLNVLYII